MEITIIISSAVVSAAISLAGVIISSLVAKSSATKTAKITTDAEIQKLKIELAHSLKIRREDIENAASQKLELAYREMISAVTSFRNKPDANTQAAAVDALSALIFISSEPKDALKNLLGIVQSADPFDGVDHSEIDALLSSIIE